MVRLTGEGWFWPTAAGDRGDRCGGPLGWHGPAPRGPTLLAPTEALPSCEVRDPGGALVALDCARCWMRDRFPRHAAEAAVDALGLED
jgi:hypothetical protein